MKKSKYVGLGILAVTALSVMGCDDDQSTQNEEVRHCVNPDGVVVDESLCNGVSDAGTMVQTTDDAGNVVYVPSGSPTVFVNEGNGGGGGPIIFYRWYYGGYSRPVAPGTRIIVNGNGYGRFTPSVGHVYSTPSTFGRGGFGSVGRGFSGGGGNVGGGG